MSPLSRIVSRRYREKHVPSVHLFMEMDMEGAGRVSLTDQELEHAMRVVEGLRELLHQLEGGEQVDVPFREIVASNLKLETEYLNALAASVRSSASPGR